MAVRRNYRINLRNYGNPPAIMVSQYDENYDLVFEVFDGVVPATGLNAYTVKLVGRQPGEDPALKYEFTGTVSGTANNILSFTIDTTMTGKAGKGTAEIVILDTTNDVKFASFNLPVYVEKAAVPDDAIDADVERAQEIADEVQDIVDTAAAEVKGEAEAWAVGQRDGEDVPSTDPTYHNNAKYYSEVAQDIADSIGIDATLSVSGKAADAKATGDEISELKEDLSDVETSIGDLSNLTTSAKGNLVAAINEAAQTGSGNAEVKLPKLYITGDISKMTTAKNEVKEYSYKFVDSDDSQYSGFCSMKMQGESSLHAPKKNYTIKFFYDYPHKRKENVNLMPLGIKKNKFVVKANWADRTMARNVISCRLWGQMVKSRHTAPIPQIAETPNWGAINGYPIRVYVNGNFHGLYSFNIPKDADLFGMDEDNPLHCAVCGDSNVNNDDNAAAFRSTTIGNCWELEVPDTWQTFDTEEEIEGQTVTVTHAVKDNLSATIGFVINSTDEEFVAGINDHIDLESAIDYYILCYMDSGVDSLARNLILLTYDGGYKWYCSAYDKDLTWGTLLGGTADYKYNRACPEEYYCTYSLLWERLEECFGDAIYDRWTELKHTILSPEYIKQEFRNYWNHIPDADYAMDIAAWPDMPQSTVYFKPAIENLIDARWAYVDSCITAMRTPVACTSITLDEETLTFSDGTPVTLTTTVEPADTTDTIMWISSNTDVATVNNGVVTPVGNGTCTIIATCGNQSDSCTVTVSALAYTVTLSGTGATLSPTTDVTPGGSYSGTLVANTGYTIDGVVIMMGEDNITSTAYNNGTISIASVTGNIVVTVNTSISIDPTGLQYTLPSTVTFDGQTYVDTGYQFDSAGNDSLSIFVEAEVPQDTTTTQYLFGQKKNTTARCCFRAQISSLNPALNNSSVSSGVGSTAGQRYKMVFRYNASTEVQAIRSSVAGSETTSSNGINTTGVRTKPSANAWGGNLYIGGINNNGTLESPMLTGKIYQMQIYDRRLTDAEVCALLGLSSLSTTPFTDDLDPTS